MLGFTCWHSRWKSSFTSSQYWRVQCYTGFAVLVATPWALTQHCCKQPTLGKQLNIRGDLEQSKVTQLRGEKGALPLLAFFMFKHPGRGVGKISWQRRQNLPLYIPHAMLVFPWTTPKLPSIIAYSIGREIKQTVTWECFFHDTSILGPWLENSSGTKPKGKSYHYLYYVLDACAPEKNHATLAYLGPYRDS